MDIFLTVLLILAALILLYVLWCLAEPFFLVNDRVVLKKHETDKGVISKETISKLPFVPQGSSDAPDLKKLYPWSCSDSCKILIHKNSDPRDSFKRKSYKQK